MIAACRRRLSEPDCQCPFIICFFWCGRGCVASPVQLIGELPAGLAGRPAKTLSIPGGRSPMRSPNCTGARSAISGHVSCSTSRRGARSRLRSISLASRSPTCFWSPTVPTTEKYRHLPYIGVLSEGQLGHHRPALPLPGRNSLGGLCSETEPADRRLPAHNFPFGNTSTLPWRPRRCAWTSAALMSSIP